jgi:multicomponent Na+:H+ antiporter subunit F
MRRPAPSPVHSRNIWGRPLAEAILIVAAILIFLGVAFGVLRLILGQSTVDRVAAIDMLTVVSISLIALYAHVAGRSIYLDVALVYGVLSFLAVLAIARYLERGL